MQATPGRNRERKAGRKTPKNRKLLLAAMLSGGACAGFVTDARPAQAAGTAANTIISNTASATYNDPNNAGTTLNATSNTVTVTVAEVAGITVGAAAVTDPAHPGNILPGDVVNYDFTVTNIGNASNTFALPGGATVTGSGTAGTLVYSTDGGATFPASNAVPSGGLAATASVPANGSIIVRVPVTVSASASTGDMIKVLLGNTGANDNTAGTQNIQYPDPSAGNDVHTDSTTAQNGTREASWFQNGTVGTQPQALALVLLTRTGFVQGATPAADTLTYALELKINSATPTGAGASHALAAADLAPTPISLNGASSPEVLVSDAIPAGTALATVGAPPSGWTAVYSVTATGTNADAAAWTTAAPSDLSLVTRIGFIHAGSVAQNADVTGLSYTVTTTGASSTASTQVNNIAQVFGQSVGDAANALVFDESGDQNPSNFNADGSRGISSPVPTGVANPASDGTDPGNNNSGTGTQPGGRDNIYTVSPAGTILNGPSGQPGATGPSGGIDDDFSSLSVPVPPGTPPGTRISPGAPVVFTNTLRNPGANPISGNTLLLPAAPASPGDLPNGTAATISYGGASATYTYNSTSGLWGPPSGVPITISSLAAATSVDYTVSVQLPANTPLNTDPPVTASPGFPVTIQAFVDANGNGQYDSGEPGNKTIDRTYTGFLSIAKLARIVAADGTTVIQPYSAGPTSANIQPGRFIDYQITYTNISQPAGSGAGDAVLNAGTAVITEDGTSGANNWALTGPDGVSLTSNVVSSAADSGGGAIAFFNGNPPASGTDRTGTAPSGDVTKYVDTASGPIAPGTSRTFTFRRKIN